jgi:hypothetical protein
MGMNGFRQRVTILCLLALLFLGSYATARRYSAAIVAFVIEEALVQKAPDEVGPERAERHFHAWLDAARPEDKLMKLLDLSKYLEKVQKLSVLEMEQLLSAGAGAPDRF